MLAIHKKVYVTNIARLVPINCRRPDDASDGASAVVQSEQGPPSEDSSAHDVRAELGLEGCPQARLAGLARLRVVRGEPLVGANRATVERAGPGRYPGRGAREAERAHARRCPRGARARARAGL